MKRVKEVVAYMLVIVCAVAGCRLSVFAQENPLAEYEEELAVLNERLGRNYELFPTGEDTYEDMVAFYTQMTMEEFDEYIYNAYEAELLFDQRLAERSNQESIVMPRYTFLEVQKYFYDNITNYLYLRANVSDIDGVAYYDSTYSLGSYIGSFPGFNCESSSVSYSSDKREAYCTWRCTKHLSRDVILTGTYTFSCTFTAEGGHVYGGVAVSETP